MNAADVAGLSGAELQALLDNIDMFSEEDQRQILSITEELERRAHAKHCRMSLIEFCKHIDPTYIVATHHRKLAQLLEDMAYGRKDRIAVSIPPRHGKLCADSTPVLTPQGWKTHGELQIGDYVYGPDGVPVPIIAVSAPGLATLEFVFSNGDTIKVHENHEWTLHYKPIKQNITMESREFIGPMRDPRGCGRQRALWAGKRGKRGSKALWKLPKISPVQFSARELPIAPYLLGAWLGDGTAGKTTLTMSKEDIKYVLPAFVEAGYPPSATFIHKDTDVPTVSFGSGRMGVKSAFKTALEAAGTCYVKRIPDEYKFSSVQQRLELLAGLIDTDGHVEKNTGRVRIVTASEDLANDIAEVATSLAFAPYITTQQPSLSSSGIQGRQVVYTVGFQPRMAIPTRLPRKRITGNIRQDRDPSLVEVRVAQQPEIGKCIQVARDDGLYLVGRNLTPTHNSHLASTLFPAWFLGKFPEKKVLMVSHTADLAVSFGRKVRNIIADPLYQQIFPGISLSADSKSAGRWETNKKGEYFAVGVGGAVAGRGADLLLVDDPHNEQDIINGNFETFEKAYQWFTFGARTRLMSGGRIGVIHCMVGDTNVLLADGRQKLLRNVRPGDVVASYDNGILRPAPVLNWASQGLDRILSIKTTSGKILRANERHPFLVALSGEKVWTKTKDLRIGASLVGVSPQGAQKKRTLLENVDTITTRIGGNRKLPPSQIIGGSGAVLNAVQKGVNCLYLLKDYANHIITSLCGRKGGASGVQRKTAMPTLNIGTALAWKNTIECSQSRMGNAQFAYALPDQRTPLRIGKENSGWTIATAVSVFAHCCATLATSLSTKVIQKKHSYAPLSIYEPTLDQIVEIKFDGYEEVFDIQVAEFENFIANGIVSHNTRWHQDDLIGQLVRDGTKNPKADQYEVFEFPAVLETDSGPKALWPEKFDLDALERTKASMPVFQWNAQYMQQPTAEEAAIVKREWWRPWVADKPPRCDYIIMTLDAAAEKHNRADYTALLTFGVFRDEHLTNDEPHLILLNAVNVRVEFPELKDLAWQEYRAWEPDSFIVEKKSAGTQLYQELRRVGIPVQEFSPSRATGDKIARLNAVADILRSGMVWYPQNRRWAEEVIEQCVAFPFGSHDDIVDCVSMALTRFRQGGFIELPSDWRDPEPLFRRKTAAYYSV